MTEKTLTKELPEEDTYCRIRTIRDILYKNTKNIHYMWERICTEIHTPPLATRKEDLQKLKKTYKEIPTEILEHTQEQRLEYVINERNKIIKESLGKDYETIANKIKTENKEEAILDICKIVLWNWLDTKTHLNDKLSKYI